MVERHCWQREQPEPKTRNTKGTAPLKKWDRGHCQWTGKGEEGGGQVEPWLSDSELTLMFSKWPVPWGPESSYG